MQLREALKSEQLNALVSLRDSLPVSEHSEVIRRRQQAEFARAQVKQQLRKSVEREG